MNSWQFLIIVFMLRSAKNQRLNFKTKYYQSTYHCFTKLESLCLFFVQTRTQKHKKCVAYVYMYSILKKNLQCFSIQIQRVAHCIIALSGDIEKNPGPFTQTNDKNVSCIKLVNPVSLLESRLSQLGRFPVNVLGDRN